MSVTAGPTGQLGERLEDTYARAVPDLVVPWRAAAVPAPRVVVRNDALAAELGLDPTALTADGLLVGQVPDDVTPVAQAYSGHQFGMYQPRLGDGRALVLGELVDPQGHRHDVALKGSGRTPFARGGDGKAAVGPMLREYLMGEAMHALGIPTSRGLAVTLTGEDVPRDTGRLPGAVLTRVAASHLRVGTFQYAAANHGPEVVRALADHAIARHHPQVAGATASDPQGRYLELYRAVIDTQAALVAQWMLVGFIHGVMNTDNTTISGETIDYGPCAFMDRFDPATVFSSIDHAGRYAYGHQPRIVQWNLARLAETLVPLLDDDPERAVEKATEAVNSFAGRYDGYWLDGMTAKLGLAAPDRELTHDLLDLLRDEKVDWTTFFRALPRGTARDLVLDREAFDAWAARWEAQRDPAARPDEVNPLYIPRNHLVEEALDAASAGDTAPFEALLDVVTRPYEQRPGLERYTEPGTGPHVTYCGT